MPLVKYRIYELSARAVISYGRQQEGTYAFHLSAAETERCKSLSVPHEQDDMPGCDPAITASEDIPFDAAAMLGEDGFHSLMDSLAAIQKP